MLTNLDRTKVELGQVMLAQQWT